MAERDAEIREQLTELLKTEYYNIDINLSFRYNTKQYSITFNSQSDDSLVNLINNCLHVGYYKEGSKISSAIKANSPENKCFVPILLTNARNKPEPRTKNVDVLQVLKTKLALCLPNEDTPITLYDAARSDHVALSPFYILRGGDAIYEKYGYESEEVTQVKAFIAQSLWKDIAGSEADKQELKWNGTPVWSGIPHSIQKFIETTYEEGSLGELLPDMKLTEIMKKIPFETENTQSSGVSEKIFEFVLERMGIDISNIGYTLNPRSKAWKSWNQKLLFTDMEIIETPPPAVAPPPIRISAPPLPSIKKRIASMKKAISMTKKLSDKRFRSQLPRYRKILKGLKIERNTKRGGGRRQTKKNRRHK
jgi:hypothetical protein